MSPDVAKPAAEESALEHHAPMLRIVHGDPTPDEVAVIVAVVASRAAQAEAAPQFSLWSRKSRQVRPSLRPGFGAWRASTMPR